MRKTIVLGQYLSAFWLACIIGTTAHGESVSGNFGKCQYLVNLQTTYSEKPLKIMVRSYMKPTPLGRAFEHFMSNEPAKPVFKTLTIKLPIDDLNVSSKGKYTEMQGLYPVTVKYSYDADSRTLRYLESSAINRYAHVAKKIWLRLAEDNTIEDYGAGSHMMVPANIGMWNGLNKLQYASCQDPE